MPPPTPPQTVRELEVRTLVPFYRPKWQGPELPFYFEDDDEDDTWLIDGQAAELAGHMLDTYLIQDCVTCCTCTGGLGIWVDGKRWNEGGVDEWWMTMTWFDALFLIIHGGGNCRVKNKMAIWEQSDLILERHQDRLVLWDGDREGFCWPIDVDLHVFVGKMVLAARDLQRFFERLQAAVLERARGQGVSATVLEEIYQSRPETAVMSDVEKLAAVLEQLHRLRHFDKIPRVAAWVEP